MENHMPDELKTLPPWRTAEKHILEIARRCYPSREQRAAVRGGLGDAAALCDAIAKVQKTKAEEAVAKLCADAIWEMRNKLQVPHV